MSESIFGKNLSGIYLDLFFLFPPDNFKWVGLWSIQWPAIMDDQDVLALQWSTQPSSVTFVIQLNQMFLNNVLGWAVIFVVFCLCLIFTLNIFLNNYIWGLKAYLKSGNIEINQVFILINFY